MTSTQPASDPSAPAAPLTDSDRPGSPPVLDVVIPVYNEAHDLEPCVRRLRAFLDDQLPVSARIIIADNASTDRTWEIAQTLTAELPGVRALHLAEKGRGRALHAAWAASDAAILAYMDVDLSTDLAALHPLIAPLLSGHSDLAIGTRLTPSARVVRGPRRELISRAYNTLLHATLGTRFSDAQCGFKALRRDRAMALLPLVADNEWFFDTELLVLAERAGLRIHEVPVDWIDDPDSRVDIASTALADLKGVLRLRRSLATGRLPLDAVNPDRTTEPPQHGLAAQVLRFATIGVASTLAYLLLFVALRTTMNSFAANAIALLVTAVANTSANRRLTFGITDRVGAVKHQAQGLGVFLLALAITTASLAGLHAASPNASRLVELTVLVGSNLFATIVRFVILRGWVFRHHA